MNRVASNHEQGTPFQFEGKYERYHIPADWKLAQAHAEAVRPGKPIPGKVEACPCCYGYIEKEQVGYCQNTRELAFLGEGFPLFFNFLRYCLVMLVALILDDAIIGVLISFSENHCQQVHAQATPTNPSQTNCQDSFSNKFAYISSVESIARTAIKITGFIAQLLILVFFRDQQNKLASYIDERNCTMSDYTVHLWNIPVGLTDNKQRITRLLKTKDSTLQAMDILLIEAGGEYVKQTEKMKEIVKERQKAIRKGDTEEVLIALEQEEMKQRALIDGICQKLRADEKSYFQGEMFVILNTDVQKMRAIDVLNALTVEEVQREYPSYTGRPKLEAVEAPQPKEIVWKHIHLTRTQRFMSIFVGWIITIAIMVAITVSFFFLIRYKSNLIEDAHLHYTEDPVKYGQEYTEGVVLGYLIVILINLINKFLFAPLFHVITHYEKHLSVSSENYSFALKYTLCMFFTTACMTLLVEAIIYGNYMGSLGVIEEETSMFIFNAYFTPLVWLINPYNVVAWIKRKIYCGNEWYTQHQANELMELPEYNMGKRYAQIIKTIWFTFLYVELIPFGAIYSFTGLLLYYFVDKYVLLRRSSIKSSVSSQLSRTMVTVLDLTLIFKPAGELIFDSHLRDTLSISSLVMLIVGIVYMLLPLNAILNWAHFEYFEPETETYEAKKNSFPETYFTLYPIQREETAIQYCKTLNIGFHSQSKNHDNKKKKADKRLITEQQLTNISSHQLNDTEPRSSRNTIQDTSFSNLPPVVHKKGLV